MDTMTVDLEAELTARVTELLADELVILAEAQDGSSVPWATRPLSEQEQESGVRFGEIHGLQETLLETVEPVLAGLSAVTVAAVVDAAGRSAKDMLATLAEYERELITERVNAGIAAAKQNGTRFGRPPVDPAVIAEKLEIAGDARAKGRTAEDAARLVGWSRATLYRHRQAARAREAVAEQV